MKKLLSLMLTVLLLVSGLSAFAENADFAAQFEGAVDTLDSIWTRWWIISMNEYYTEETIDEEIRTMSEAGIALIEVNNQMFLWTDSRNDPAGHGNDSYLDVFYWICKAADKYGVTIDWTTGAMYPADIPDDSEYYSDSILTYKWDWNEMDVGEGLVDEQLVVKSSSSNGFPVMGVAMDDMGESSGEPAGETEEAAETSEEAAPVEEAAEEAAPAEETAEEAAEEAAAVPDGFGASSGASSDEEENVLTASNERIEAVTALYVLEDGQTAVAAMDITENTDLVTYADVDDTGRKSGTISVTEADLNALYGSDLTGGSWKVFAFFSVKDSGGGIDYLSAEATQAWANHWNNEILASAYLNEKYASDLAEMGYADMTALFEAVSGNVWEDSLESFAINYTTGIFDSFKEINGYDFPMEKLPMMLVSGKFAWFNDYSAEATEGADYILDATADKQLRHDYYDTLSALYNENHLGGYLAFAESHGMGTRVQAAYNYTLDQDSAMPYLTIAENETLNAQNSLDVYRSYAGGAHVNGINTISSESGANSDVKSFTVLWSDWLWYFNMQYAGGVNQAVLHGVDTQYGTWGTSTWAGRSGAGATAGQCESMGERMPYFEILNDSISSYLARQQFILKSGLASSDLAIYYYAYDYGLAGDGGRNYFTDEGMQDAGYTYEFLGDTSLTLAQAGENGSVEFYADGELTASYKALVLNQTRETDQGYALDGEIPVDTAEKILELAKAGANVFVIGAAPDKAADGKNIENADKKVQSVMAELLALENVHQVESESAMTEALMANGIVADVVFDASGEGDTAEDLLTYHRTEENADFYFLFNSSYTSTQAGTERQLARSGSVKSGSASEAHAIRTYVELSGSGVPYLLDCWSGEITRIPEYEITEEGKYRVYVEMDANATMIIAVGEPDWYTDGFENAAYATASDAELAYNADGTLNVLAEEAGTYEVTLSDGTVKEVTVENVPEDVNLTDGTQEWTLNLKMYEPNDAFKSGDTSGINSYLIEKPEAETITLTELKAWKDLAFTYKESGEAVYSDGISGVGTYETTFTLPDDYDANAMGYVLTIDEMTEVGVITVNGTEVGIDQSNGDPDYALTADISAYLVPGENTLKIEVASGLFNAMKYWSNCFYNDATFSTWVSPDGLIGTVSLNAYAKAGV